MIKLPKFPHRKPALTTYADLGQAWVEAQNNLAPGWYVTGVVVGVDDGQLLWCASASTPGGILIDEQTLVATADDPVAALRGLRDMCGRIFDPASRVSP